MHRMTQWFASFGIIALVAAFLPLTASAHEHREVGNGQYTFVIGFINEPAFVGEQNGLSLAVTKKDAAGSATPAAGDEEGTPVEGLFATLQAEVIYGDQTMALPLTPAFREPGRYRSVFFPMAEGDYTFRIFGEIEGTPIDESFTSSPEGFDSVQPREPFEFPKEGSASAGTGVVAAGMVDGGTGGGFSMPIGGLMLPALAGLAGYALMRRRTARAASVGIVQR